MTKPMRSSNLDKLNFDKKKEKKIKKLQKKIKKLQKKIAILENVDTLLVPKPPPSSDVMLFK